MSRFLRKPKGLNLMYRTENVNTKFYKRRMKRGRLLIPGEPPPYTYQATPNAASANLPPRWQ